MKVFSFTTFRIILLLSLLAFAAIYTKEQWRSTHFWYKPIEVVIYPINADGYQATQDYIHTLSQQTFQDIDTFFTQQAKHYQLIASPPVVTVLGPQINTVPPPPPADRQSPLQVILWSLRLRYWAYRHTPDQQSNINRIRLFVLYHQGQKGQALPHSLGLQKGRLGVIHAFASHSQDRQNTIVMAHEILHTVGATDKYDLSNNQPVFPDGFALPHRTPLYPQRYAEIMAGRIPVSPTRSVMPPDLRFCTIGQKTASEINWTPEQ